MQSLKTQIDEAHINVLCVNINNSYDAYIKGDIHSPYFRPNKYECTNHIWNVSDEKANKADYLFGCYKGKVKEVIKIESYESADYNGKTRKIFHGEEIKFSPFLGGDIHELFDTLANFNTKYYGK